MRLVAVALVALAAGFGAGYAAGDNNHPAKVVVHTRTDRNPFDSF